MAIGSLTPEMLKAIMDDVLKVDIYAASPFLNLFKHSHHRTPRSTTFTFDPRQLDFRRGPDGVWVLR